MTWIEIELLAMALAADAFSVGAAVGLNHRQPRQVFRLAWHFGLFQSLLAFLGLMAGSWILAYAGAWDHWVACALLCFIGGRMITHAFDGAQGKVDIDLTKGFSLVGLSVAVSIDALAAGFSLSAVEVPTVFCIASIGIVSGLATWLAMRLAGLLRPSTSLFSGVIAGLVLIALGIRFALVG